MKCLVTGSNGFLGTFVTKELEKKYKQDIEIVYPRSYEYDLIDRNMVDDMYAKYKPNVVIHLAAEVGGIGANMENPGRFFYANASMGINMVEGARLNNVDKFIFVSTVCGYPKYANAPFLEDEMWDGYPEETNAPYGIAKKGVMVMLDGYYRQYGLKSATLVPTNLYGPNDFFSEKESHVIPGLISRMYKNIMENIDINRAVLENIDIDIDKEILENIDIDKEISENIDIDKISNRLEFGISNRAIWHPCCTTEVKLFSNRNKIGLILISPEN